MDTGWGVVHLQGTLTPKHAVTQIAVVIRGHLSLGGIKMFKDVSAYRPCPERDNISLQTLENKTQETLAASPLELESLE